MASSNYPSDNNIFNNNSNSSSNNNNNNNALPAAGSPSNQYVPFVDETPQTPVVTGSNSTSGSSSLISPAPGHDEVAAANAEAMRLAIEMGVASSVRNTRKRGTLRQLLSPSPLSNNLSPKSSTSLFPTSTSLALQQQQQQQFNNYNNVGANGLQPAPSDVLSASAAGLLGQYQNSVMQQQQQQQQPQSNASHLPSIASGSQYRPPSAAYRSASPSIQSASSYAASEGSQSLHIFDCHGQRTPYREGPYFVHHEKDGRRIKKRWYGRLEDGYLAWSSIFLHEMFGFTIYTPLTAEEHRRMKEYGKVPKWMNEFTSLPNLAIPLSYFCIGVALQLLRTPLIVYFIEDLNASAAEVNVLFTVMAVPWCFKVIYGFLSDCCPISGLRRKPYFMTGWLVYIVSNLILMISPIPSIQLCILLVFTQTAGYMLADVMTDALIVERSRYETQDTRGTMQSQGYIIRFFGSTIGAAIGAVVYNKDSWGWYLPMRLVFFINAAFPLIFLLPVVPYLLELETHCSPKNFFSQCKELFETAQLRSVWQPMTFVYVYNALQLTNAAWMNFLVEGLNFTAWQIGIVSVFGSVMAWFGIMTYKRFFFASNWRIVYFWCTSLASLIALGQLILVFGLNRSIGLRIGVPGIFPARKVEIPDIWFSMGDDVLVEFVIAVQFLPMCIMYLGLCPEGSEGTTYAMLTTWSNLAGSLAFDISTALTAVWDVSSATIEAGNYSGVWKLSLLAGLIGPAPLVLLGLIPKNKDDQRRLQADQTRHYWAGVLFIFVMIATLIITFAESVYEVYFKNESESLVSK